MLCVQQHSFNSLERLTAGISTGANVGRGLGDEAGKGVGVGLGEGDAVVTGTTASVTAASVGAGAAAPPGVLYQGWRSGDAFCPSTKTRNCQLPLFKPFETFACTGTSCSASASYSEVAARVIVPRL